MAHLQAVVEADSMEALIDKCNLISLKAGTTFRFSDSTTYDGKKFYKTYYFEVENLALFNAVLERIKSEKSKD